MEPWYAEGLRFECTGCGKCCRGKPGYVWVTVPEMQKIASYLKLTLDAFTGQFIRLVEGRYSLIEVGSDFACVFLEGNQCSIYEERPNQCRTFPFWGKHLASRENWDALKKECEGINDEAPLISIEEIRSRSGS